MTEVTLAASPVAAEVRDGSIVRARPGGCPEPVLAIVADADYGPGAVRVLARRPGDDVLILHAVPRDSLLAPPAQPDAAQWAMAQRLAAGLAGQARDRHQEAETARTAATGRVKALTETIHEMRAYAITKHREGEICRGGLDDFLAAHDLDPYQPRYSARVTVTFGIEINGADDEDDAARMARDNIEVRSLDDFEVSIFGEDVEVYDLGASDDDD